MKEEIEEWWEKGKKDLETARYNLKGNELDAAAFYAQQAAEKALKALQIKKSDEFEKTHDLVAIAKNVDAPEEIIRLCETVTPFYTVTRYPNAEVFYHEEKISSVIKASRRVCEWVEQNLR